MLVPLAGATWWAAVAHHLEIQICVLEHVVSAGCFCADVYADAVYECMRMLVGCSRVRLWLAMLEGKAPLELCTTSLLTPGPHLQLMC